MQHINTALKMELFICTPYVQLILKLLITRLKTNFPWLFDSMNARNLEKDPT